MLQVGGSPRATDECHASVHASVLRKHLLVITRESMKMKLVANLEEVLMMMMAIIVIIIIIIIVILPCPSTLFVD